MEGTTKPETQTSTQDNKSGLGPAAMSKCQPT